MSHRRYFVENREVSLLVYCAAAVAYLAVGLGILFLVWLLLERVSG